MRHDRHQIRDIPIRDMQCHAASGNLSRAKEAEGASSSRPTIPVRKAVIQDPGAASCSVTSPPKIFKVGAIAITITVLLNVDKISPEFDEMFPGFRQF